MPTHRYTLPLDDAGGPEGGDGGPEGAREAACARLWAAGALGLWERPGAVVAWFEECPGELPGLPDLPEGGRWETEPDRDWQQRWRAGLKPVRAGRFTIVPSWQVDGDAPREADTIVLDPGRAFGSGHHATTTLCLEQLSELELHGRRVLDLGTGSGILAIAAARSGADEVLAVDHDPTAIEVARANLERCVGSTVPFRLLEAGLERLDDLGGFDVVLANLQTATLIAGAGRLSATVTEGGVLVASGVAAERLGRVDRAFRREGLGRPTGVATRERWVAIRWHRRGSEAGPERA